MTRRGYDPLVDPREGPFQTHVVAIARDLGWGITHQASKSLAEEAAQWGVTEPMPIDGLIFHPRIMYRSEPGWPDLVLIRRRDRRLLFVECKTDQKASKLSPRQAEVLGLLCSLFGVDWLDPVNRETTFAPMDTLAGSSPLLRVGVYVWRPSDLPDIRRVLA